MSFFPPESKFFGYEDHHQNPHHFQGIESTMISRSLSSYSGRDQGCEETNAAGDGDTSEDKGSQLGEKKKRFNIEQMKALEKSFELGDKLEPERKRQLARELGVQPRQVAIWFQNRRTRYKTKQLKKDSNVLKRQFDEIKAENGALKNHNNKLQAQLMALRGQELNGSRAMMNLKKEKEGSSSNNRSTDNSCEDNNTILYNQISNNHPTSSSIIGGLTMTPYLLGQPLTQTVVNGDHGGYCNMLNAAGDGDTSENEGSQLGEKKKILNIEQFKALEKSFELGDKLEPERKRQLARELGLQPRQVAIWFQNRRARYKTKQLEKDSNVLKRQFDEIKAENGALKNHNNKLQAQLMALRGQELNGSRAMMNLKKEKEGSSSNNRSTDNSCEDNNTILYNQISNNHPTSSSMIGGLTMTPYLLGQPLTQTVVNGDHGGYCNMLNVMEDQPAFRPWPEADYFDLRIEKLEN
ncbi:uncharacterized protein [Rutidosis leptorrhynchoides]|uniref:uncharacterized protein n=1 Tax=Rutidosis leptorrhynchoides TaxID=125765 RepID=UPI003A9937B9